MKNKQINNISNQSSRHSSKSSVINIENSDVLEIFGINNENLSYFESSLPLKIFQKGNELNIRGEIKYQNILRNAIHKTLTEIKLNKNLRERNLVQENLKMQLTKDTASIKNFTITKTNKVDVVGKSNRQNDYLEILRKKQIIFAIGPAGTGKTFLAVAAAVSQLMENKFDRIILSRPAVEAGEKLGFLPGDLKDKVDPYLTPLYDALNQMLSKDKLNSFMDNKQIEIAPLAYMRGRTLHNSFIILDEAQNSTQMQMKMFLTRIGVTSKAIITGDVTQIDLPQNQNSGLIDAIKILKKIKGICFVELDDSDVVRHRLVKEIINAYTKKGN